MRNWSIVTKIVASACGIVCTLVLLGGFVLIKFEIRMVHSFTEEILSGMHHFIDERAEEEEKSLREDVKFNAEILSGIGATYLYNLDQDGLKYSLRPYMNYPEIVAIKALDEKSKPFAAAWRNSGIKTGDALPQDLKLNDSLSVSVDCMQDAKKIGNFQVYYIDTLLKEKIKIRKKKASEEAKIFENASRSQLNRAIASQTIGVFVILLALVVSLIFFLRALVLKPLNDVSEIAHKLSDFNLTVGINITRKDEIGGLTEGHRWDGHIFSEGCRPGPALRYPGYILFNRIGRHCQRAGDYNGKPGGIYQQGCEVGGADFRSCDRISEYDGTGGINVPGHCGLCKQGPNRPFAHGGGYGKYGNRFQNRYPAGWRLSTKKRKISRTW